MKHLLALTLLAAAATAHADTGPKTLSLQKGSTLQLQGWTRLNGTTAFQAPPKAEAPVTAERPQATDLQRRLALEAEYQREKAKKAKAGAWGQGY